MKTLKDTMNLDGRKDVTINGVMVSLYDSFPSVIEKLVDGSNQTWQLTEDEFFILSEEVKANIDPYAKAIEFKDGGMTFNRAAQSVTFYDVPVGNVWVQGGRI